ncbi:hypothetical protein [Proteus hauseri]|uniref:hypothetical protein n=1 Tax=Proteus hauseri TaxID=183417 RepID=UPI0032D9ADDC
MNIKIGDEFLVYMALGEESYMKEYYRVIELDKDLGQVTGKLLKRTTADDKNIGLGRCELEGGIEQFALEDIYAVEK